jgi:hypothetical protein
LEEGSAGQLGPKCRRQKAWYSPPTESYWRREHSLRPCRRREAARVEQPRSLAKAGEARVAATDWEKDPGKTAVGGPMGTDRGFELNDDRRGGQLTHCQYC